ncbi:MAG: hypothetical protein LBK76_02570 [Verrucomicrobiales bacterium]|jgi:hypothetical protein|nr:hypothetical protein [Verrucomicrobiales bacterium]
MSPAPKGNKFNARPADQRHDAIVVLRVQRSEKAAWVKTAQGKGQKLAEWMRDILNKASLFAP